MNRPLRALVPFILCGLLALQAWADPVLNPTRFSVGDGLPDSAVFSVAQTADGLLWLGTAGGLSRFNGADFTNWRHMPGDANGLAATGVSVLHPGERGLWIGTWGGGLQYHAPGRGLTRYTEDSGAAARIQALARDAEGRLWVGSAGDGVRMLTPSSGTWADALLPGSRVWALEPARGAAGMWIGTSDGLFFSGGAPGDGAFGEGAPGDGASGDGASGDGASGDGASDDGASDGGTETRRVESVDGAVRALAYSHDGSLWLGGDAGLRRCVSADAGCTPEVVGSGAGVEGGFADVPVDQSVNALLADAARNWLWVATPVGLWALDLETGRPARLPGGGYLLASGQRVRSLAFDRTGLLWVGTRGGGVLRYNLMPSPFLERASGTNLLSLLALGDDRFLIGTIEGLHVLERDGAERAVEGASGPVWALRRDPEGRIWAGTHRGLAEIVGGAAAERLLPVRADGLPDDDVFIVSTGVAGLWLGGARAVTAFDPASGVARAVDAPELGAALTPGARVSALLESAPDTLWVGTAHSGLYRLQAQAGDWDVQAWRGDASASERRIPDDLVNGLALDARGGVWVATDDGLGEITRDGAVRTFGREDGLPAAAVESIQFDADGNLWAAGARGLSRLEPALGRISNFSRFDGLTLLEYKAGAFTRDGAGRLWFGGHNGMSGFAPAGFAQPDATPAVSIEAVRADAVSVVREGDAPLQLAAGLKRLEIDFMLADYRDPAVHRLPIA